MADARNDLNAVLLAEERADIAALQARAALAGWTLAEARTNTDARFLATRWGRSRELRDVVAVHDFLQYVEGRRG